MPPDKQRRAGFRQQLPETALVQEYRHAVKRERQREHVHYGLIRYFVGVVQRPERREGEQRGGGGYPSAARRSRQRQIREQRRAREHGEHEKPNREYLGGEVVPERHGGELYERRPSHGEAAVHLINRLPVRARRAPQEQPKVVGRREILRQRHVLGRVPVVGAGAVEGIAVSREDERRRQRRREQDERQPPNGEARGGCSSTVRRTDAHSEMVIECFHKSAFPGSHWPVSISLMG